MNMSDSELRKRFVMAINEVLPPAPWLESQVIEVTTRRQRHRGFNVGMAVGLTSGLRLAAGLIAVLIVIATVGALLISARLHSSLVPANPKTHVQTPSATPSPKFAFTPSPAVRAANWPPGGTVPTALAGCWQPKFIDSKYVLCLGGYTWDWIDNSVPNGNVVVNGSEIDFISDVCTNAATFGYDRYSYTITGDTLVLTRSGPRTCGWALQGSWTKVASQ